MDDAISALAKLRAVRATHVGDLSRGDLLTISRAGRELVAHAEAELKRRARFPSRLAPDLVLRFLDVPGIGASLAVSAGWSKTAEAVFQSVAADLGVTSIAEGQQWHDIVREQVSRRWIGATFDPDDDGGWCFQPEIESIELGKARVSGDDVYADTYVIGRGSPLRQGCERIWRIRLDKDPHIIDAVGWCISSSSSSMRPLRMCLWNSDGEEYNSSDHGRYDRLHEPVFSAEDEDVSDWFQDETMEVRVRRSEHALHTSLEGVPFQVRYTLHEQDWADLARHDLVIAPLVRIYETSVATFV